VGKGGMLFHYNRPYADLFMEIEASCRRQGLGAWLVQELKRLCYGYGAIPAARCSVHNIASRQTLQKAGFVPWAHIVTASLAVG
jgi:GNAT superfamily N-acetyltransferase